MHSLTKKWEVALLPIVLIIGFSMICLLEGCKNDTGNNVDEIVSNKKAIEKKSPATDSDKPKEEISDSKKTETKPEEVTKKPVVKPPEESTKTEKENELKLNEKKSDYSGDVKISLSNFTYGYVTPCG